MGKRNYSINGKLPELMICNFANMDDKKEGGGNWWGKVNQPEDLQTIVNDTNKFCYYFLLKLQNELNNIEYSHPYFATLKTNLENLLDHEAMKSRDPNVNLENLEKNYNTCYKSISSILPSSQSQTQEGGSAT